MRWLQLQHAIYQVLELRGHEVGSLGLVLGVGSPKDIRSVVGNAFVERILLLRGSEWWVTRNHDEQDDSRSEQIHLTTNIWLSKMDLWSHVVLSS